MPDFDLATDPWIPVRPLGGGSVEPVGLQELFLHAHEYADVELPLPPASAGLWRILALIAARLTGMDFCTDWQDWAAVRAEALAEQQFDPDEVSDYFEQRYPGRFALFGDRPWLQDPRLGGAEAQCPKTSGINKLCWGRPAGNTQVWLRHTTDLTPLPLSAAEAAHHLIATLYYGPSGRCTLRTAGGQSAANTTAGPLRRSLSFHPVGRSLFESLLLNIPYIERDEDDLAPWERTELDAPTLPPPSVGLAGRLTNQFRHAVLLHPASQGTEVVDATVTWGLRMSPELQARWTAPEDPYQIYVRSDEGHSYPEVANADRAIWRDVAALLQDGLHRGKPTRKPRLHEHLRAGLPTEVRQAMRARAFGFDQNGQARDKQWFTATTPPVLRWLHESPEDPQQAGQALNRIRQTTDAAEDAGRRLERQLARAWKDSGLGGEPKQGERAPWTSLGTTRYWSQAQELFWRMVEDDAVKGPGNTFIRAALQAYTEATEDYRHRPRVARAVARHQDGLFANWIPEPTDGRGAT